MQTYYDKSKQRLVFVHERSTPTFWDTRWRIEDIRAYIQQRPEKLYVASTRRFLPSSKSIRILEGGCGRGQFVHALDQAGYSAYGVDYAEQTVRLINQAMPQLAVSMGDVTRLDFPDHFFDGYWSLGVIEHTYSGYQPIVNEMVRVIKPGGFLFLTFPHLSPLRRAKAALGMYQKVTQNSEPDNFYQFALNARTVQAELEDLGFNLRQQRPLDGFKGIQEEVTLLQPLLQKVSRSSSTCARYTREATNVLATFVSGHIVLQIYQRSV